MDLKCFIFDLDDTLYDLEQPFLLAYKVMFKKIPYNIHEIFLAFRKYNNEIYDKALRGEITMEYLCIYRISRALSDFGIIINYSEAMEFQLTYLRGKKNITLDKNMEELLSILKRKNIKVGLISNGPHKEQFEKINYLGLNRYIDNEFILISEDIGYHKPDKEIFDFAVNKFKHRFKDEFLDFYYIGDSFENDIIGATKAGLKTLWINKRCYKTLCENYPDKYIFTNTLDLKNYIINLINKKDY